eukprot:4892290-Pyramimonas_sp.AAC.1
MPTCQLYSSGVGISASPATWMFATRTVALVEGRPRCCRNCIWARTAATWDASIAGAKLPCEPALPPFSAVVAVEAEDRTW